MRRLLRAPTLFYRAGLGRLLGRRFLQIVHVGRRTGRQYRTVLEVVCVLPASHEYVVMAGFGHTADWLRNLRAGGGREVRVGADRFRPLVRELDQDEAAAALADYERRNWLIAPVMRRVLSWLVGWRYTGTEVERARLVDQVPLIALRPAGVASGAWPRAGTALPVASATTLLVAVATGIVGIAVPFYLVNRALETTTGSTAALVLNLVPVFAVVTAVLLLHEAVMVTTVLGGGLIIVGLTVLGRTQRDESELSRAPEGSSQSPADEDCPEEPAADEVRRSRTQPCFD